MDLIAYFDGQIAVLQEAKGQYTADLQAKYDEGHAVGQAAGDAAGYARGLAENVNVPDGVFTQEEMDNAKAEADAAVRAELQPQLAALAEKVAALETQAQVDRDAAVTAMSDLKKSVAQKIRDSSVDDLAIAAELEA
jgi:hypothetical protein